MFGIIWMFFRVVASTVMRAVFFIFFSWWVPNKVLNLVNKISYRRKRSRKRDWGESPVICDAKVIVSKTKDVTDQVKLGTKTVASRVKDAGDQVKHEAKATAGKVMDVGNQVKLGTRAATTRMVDAGDQIKHGAKAAAGNVADVGNQVKLGAQVVTAKLVDAGDQVKRNTIAGANIVTEVGKEKFSEILALAEPNLKIFRRDITDASKKYTDAITHTLDLAGYKLRKSTELIDPDGRYRSDLKKVAVAFGAATAGAYTKILAASPGFTELPQALKTKIAVAGLRPEMSWRPIAMAESFYDSSIPEVVRNFGKDAVVEFLDGKHASHITSVHNDPSMTMTDSNIVWEAAGENLAREAVLI
ncbi:MAG: hypothetical protein OXE92_06035 [Bacteroidetes bacterium]|nr:hypothetical protein [Bacteroidota bacterium]